MNVVHSHVSTLYSLWKSIEIEPLLVYQKLQPVINQLEILVANERKEKRLLQAGIQDVMSNIEFASDLLGVSLESMLYSNINNDNNIVISPETLNMYNDLNATFPKQKTLNDLDSRLVKEISTRKHNMNNWLSLISILCKELDLPNKFKSIKEYQDSDLSWATVQSVSCELRDLQELKNTRIQQFNILVKTIQYYWHMTTVIATTDIEHSLYNLFENFPLDIDMTNHTTYLMDSIDYYHHPSNTLLISANTINALTTMIQQLKLIYEERYKKYQYSIKKVKAIWEELNIPLLERPSLPILLGKSDMFLLDEIVKGIEPLVKNVFELYIQNFKGKLIPLWDACLLSEKERNDFIASLYEQSTKLEIKSKVDRHMSYLESIHLEGQALKALMKERKDLIQKMIDFEKNASDPRRLFKASFQLIEEEKWRNTCLPRLLQLDRQLIKAINEFEKLAGKPVMIGEQRYLLTLLDEIADREANQTFFGFLNSEPVVSSAKRATKNRPASVGSLGSVMQINNKKPQLKTRAVSAIITTPCLSTTEQPKKIKPSQSMPLKKIKLKASSTSLSRTKTASAAVTTPGTTSPTLTTGTAAIAATVTATNTTSAEDPYSTTAYINSNINLNKAFRQQRGQMSSMIPVASRAALTTTKSL